LTEHSSEEHLRFWWRNAFLGCHWWAVKMRAAQVADTFFPRVDGANIYVDATEIWQNHYH
jgi:hypothetical protein